MQPFSITLFATSGDPEGIRHIDKSNWSGCGVVFTRDQVGNLKHEPGYSQAGVYVLVGNASEETIYIGEADPVGDRLKNHVANKEGWVWGVYFFDKNHKVGKTEVQFLEASLVALAKKYDKAILLNKNVPAEPTMAPVARATAQAFLADMLLIFPMLGIAAFSPQRNVDPQEVVTPEASNAFDTVVVPARGDGFDTEFVGNSRWFAIRINSKHLSKLKYIAAYQVAPVAAITHIADISSIEPYGDTGKYMINFKGKARPLGPIYRTEDSLISMQSPRYAQMAKLSSAKKLDDVWS